MGPNRPAGRLGGQERSNHDVLVTLGREVPPSSWFDGAHGARYAGSAAVKNATTLPHCISTYQSIGTVVATLNKTITTVTTTATAIEPKLTRPVRPRSQSSQRAPLPRRAAHRSALAGTTTTPFAIVCKTLKPPGTTTATLTLSGVRINASTYTNGTVVKTTLRFGETTASRFIAGAIALLKPVTGVVAAYAGKISAPATITLVNGLTTRAGLATATSLARVSRASQLAHGLSTSMASRPRAEQRRTTSRSRLARQLAPQHTFHSPARRRCW